MSETWNRRAFLATAGGLGLTGAFGGAAIAAGSGTKVPAPAPSTPEPSTPGTPTALPTTALPVKGGAYVLPDLPYDYSGLKGAISPEILRLHHDMHHAAYVSGANTTLEKIAAARDAGQFDALVGLEKALAFNLSGHVLHSIYWQNLAPDGGGRPSGQLASAITQDFGSFEKFAAQLTNATTSVQGSGWGVLAYEPVAERLLVEQVYDHQSNVGIGSAPLLVFDAWEHAYYLQYKNVRPDYVKKLWDVVNWQDVDARYQSARLLTTRR
jgi:Fe-Mn family superoxide dismutase